MSRAKITSTDHSATRTPPLSEDPGLSGPYATMPITETDPRIRQELGKLLEAARVLRPVLRANQDQTEIDGKYSEEVHQYFLENGFYTILLPQKFGGLELGISAFYAMIAEVARGCPSTAWCLSLSMAHTVTLASYWSETTQAEVFGQNGYMIAPASGNPTSSTMTPTEGGYLLSGTWRYCSGSPYSTHFFPTVTIPATETEEAYQAWVVVDRADYTVMDDWGRVIGMRGSGSNGITMSDVFVPTHRVSRDTWSVEASAPSIGYEIHKNPTYSGVFFGFAEGEVAAVSIGLGYAALDEYERIIRKSIVPFAAPGTRTLRVDSDEWRRVLSMAMSQVDTAAAALMNYGKQFEEFARQSAEGDGRFDSSRAMRLNGGYLVAEELVWEAMQSLIRTAGTGPSADGQALQRYFRDIWTTVSRTDQWQMFAAPAAGMHLENVAAYEAEARAAESDASEENDASEEENNGAA